MRIALYLLAAGAALSIGVAQAQPRAPGPARVAQAQPRAPGPACQAVSAANRGFAPVTMRVLAEKTEEDPQRVWTKWELWNPFSPARTTIWQGVIRTCEGDVIVSQIINRQCDSVDGCPVRVVLRDGRQDRVLLGYRQVCTIHSTFELRGDLSEMRSCGETFRLEPASPG